MKLLNGLLYILIGFVPVIDIAKAADSAQTVEEIYVVRSFRVSRDKPTANCAAEKTGFPDVKFEDHYNFQSLHIDEKTGAVIDANVATVGRLLGCLGPSSDPLKTNFYAEGTLGDMKLTLKGECLTVKKDYPEAGLNSIRCYLEVTNLPTDYLGGYLTSNTVTSKQPIGVISDPPGYTQISIATIRLWKKRASTTN
jgi:hypothetical protein